MAAGVVMGTVLAVFFPSLAIGMILVGLAVGVAMSIAFQAAADDLASRRSSRGDQA
ncbi:hypothetical protein M4D51_02865 [Microbacterium sp. p3-SID338]|uniref:hypothetical protein n=1 Tax=Microbacterium sp. p3-SID338 TaxID=2916214 RepID=UPI0021A5939B|nr:hypothetical protein [Microbacterium sp. p3-SID338]MCT1394661.1 hypothetical protein [Microbacterium sp. p3-SID338]